MKRYLGVREWSYSVDSLFGSQCHNRNENYRKSLANVIRPEETKDNIDIEGEIDLKTHYDLINDYNSQQFPKSRKRIEHIREQVRNYYFDTATTQKLLSKDYNPDDPTHIKTTKPIKWTANKGAIEQVLYFSNSINDEDLNDDDWRFIMKQWAQHMKTKYGRVMINAQFHQEELTKHIHASFSCLKKIGGQIIYSKPQMLEAGYGSSLQDDFERVFQNSINTRFKKHKMNNVYHRGEKKQSYKEVGNDHTDQADHREQMKAVSDITNTIQNENLTIQETLSHIRGLKAIYKGNKDALKLLNKFQSGFKKLNKKENELEDKEKHLGNIIKTQEKLLEAFTDDLQSTEDIVNFIKETPEVSKTFFNFGGGRLLERWDINKEKDKVVMIPTPSGNRREVKLGKIRTGKPIDYGSEVSRL